MSDLKSTQLQPVTEAPAKPARFIITAELEGFPVTVEVEGKADSLRAMVDRLKTIGAAPPALAARSTTPQSKSGVPVCPVHHSPMKPSRKPGSFFCPKQTDDGNYCKEKA
jgi:hypothetical protein